jgi:hypothetical protein
VRRFAIPVAIGAVVVATLLVRDNRSDVPAGATPQPVPSAPYRAFTDDSWWNTPLPRDAPLDPHGDEILDYLRTADESGRGCLTLAGAQDGPWGQPIYWSEPSDPTYDVQGVLGDDRPPELDRLRIPDGARAADNNDGSMTLYDLDRGYVVALTDAHYRERSDKWRASGATVTYLDSNGLHVGTGRSDDPRNRGTHRGNNGATMAVMLDEVRAGEVRHVVKVASGPELSDRAVFPMIGSDGDYLGNDPAVPPQGLRFRIRDDVVLSDVVDHPEALVIAEGLQRYGFYLGDSGGTTALKLENTKAEGEGQLWNVSADALCGLPFTPEYWDVIAEGYDPTR